MTRKGCSCHHGHERSHNNHQNVQDIGIAKLHIGTGNSQKVIEKKQRVQGGGGGGRGNCNIGKLTRYHTGTTFVDCIDDESLPFFLALNGLQGETGASSAVNTHHDEVCVCACVCECVCACVCVCVCVCVH